MVKYHGKVTPGWGGSSRPTPRRVARGQAVAPVVAKPAVGGQTLLDFLKAAAVISFMGMSWVDNDDDAVE